jgi:hypothetical protein
MHPMTDTSAMNRGRDFCTQPCRFVESQAQNTTNAVTNSTIEIFSATDIYDPHFHMCTNPPPQPYPLERGY